MKITLFLSLISVLYIGCESIECYNCIGGTLAFRSKAPEIKLPGGIRSPTKHCKTPLEFNENPTCIGPHFCIKSVIIAGNDTLTMHYCQPHFQELGVDADNILLRNPIIVAYGASTLKITPCATDLCNNMYL